MFNEIYKGKRVLLTGDTGFKGSWLGLWLHELGANVLGFALPPEQNNDHFNLLGLNKMIKHIDGDIRDYQSLDRVMKDFEPEFVFHLAAQSLVRRSYDKPKLTFDTNIAGSVNLLETIRNCSSVRVLTYITSDKCYKNKEWIWGYRENDELGGYDPYSASKAAAELVFSSYMNSFLSERENFGAASVRAGNVIGGGDWAQDRIVPDSIKALMNKVPIVLRNPQSTRPWQHVLEPLYGYLMLAAKTYAEPKRYSGAWNFGPSGDSVRTVHDLAAGIISYWGQGDIIENVNSGSSHEAGLLHLNSDKANYTLGWQTCWDFDSTIENTVGWYRGYNEGKAILELSKQQINDYMKALMNREVKRN